MYKVILLVVVSLVSVTGAFGQKQGLFPSQSACEAAINSGTAAYYIPSGSYRHQSFSFNSRTEDIRKLEIDACADMVTAGGGYHWVAQQAGEQMVFAKGTLNILRRLDCGNPIRGIVYKQEQKVVEDKPAPPAVPTCANKKWLTLEKAESLGYDIDEEGVCTKEKPAPPVVATCANKPGLTLARAYELGYDVDDEGRCTKEKPVAPVVPTCANDAGTTLAHARELGLKIDKHGVCSERKEGNVWLGALCGAAGGAGAGAYSAGGNRGWGALLGAGLGGGAGAGATKLTKKTWAGCFGGLAGFGAKTIEKKKPKTPTSNACPVGQTRTSDGRCGEKELPTNHPTPTIPSNGGPIPTGPDIPMGYPTQPCRNGTDNGRCGGPITSTPNPGTGSRTPNPGDVVGGICRPGQICVQSLNSNTRTSASNGTGWVRNTQQNSTQSGSVKTCRRGEICRAQ